MQEKYSYFFSFIKQLLEPLVVFTGFVGESILIESGKKKLTITAEQAYYLKEMLSDIDSKYNLRPQIQNK